MALQKCNVYPFPYDPKLLSENDIYEIRANACTYATSTWQDIIETRWSGSELKTKLYNTAWFFAKEDCAQKLLQGRDIELTYDEYMFFVKQMMVRTFRTGHCSTVHGGTMNPFIMWAMHSILNMRRYYSLNGEQIHENMSAEEYHDVTTEKRQTWDELYQAGNMWVHGDEAEYNDFMEEEFDREFLLHFRNSEYYDNANSQEREVKVVCQVVAGTGPSDIDYESHERLMYISHTGTSDVVITGESTLIVQDGWALYEGSTPIVHEQRVWHKVPPILTSRSGVVRFPSHISAFMKPKVYYKKPEYNIVTTRDELDMQALLRYFVRTPAEVISKDPFVWDVPLRQLKTALLSSDKQIMNLRETLRYEALDYMPDEYEKNISIAFLKGIVVFNRGTMYSYSPWSMKMIKDGRFDPRYYDLPSYPINELVTQIASEICLKITVSEILLLEYKSVYETLDTLHGQYCTSLPVRSMTTSTASDWKTSFGIINGWNNISSGGADRIVFPSPPMYPYFEFFKHNYVDTSVTMTIKGDNAIIKIFKGPRFREKDINMFIKGQREKDYVSTRSVVWAKRRFRGVRPWRRIRPPSEMDSYHPMMKAVLSEYLSRAKGNARGTCYCHTDTQYSIVFEVGTFHLDTNKEIATTVFKNGRICVARMIILEMMDILIGLHDEELKTIERVI